MAAEPVERDAGQFAEERFRRRRRAWRRRIWWVFPLLAAFFLLSMTALSVVFDQSRAFYLGVATGAIVAFVLLLWDSPPHHIERWRQGAEGEKSTGKALRKLSRKGWVAVHDIDLGRGNADHVAVGPPGVFLLESKNLNGILTVERGVLSVRWREEPDDGYQQTRLKGTMRWRAAEISRRLGVYGAPEVEVQPVVVLWGDFEQGSVLSGDVAWIRGDVLADKLARRPVLLSDDDVQRIAGALRAFVSA